MKTKYFMAAVLVPSLGLAGPSSVSEPSTVFYGKVLNQAGPVEHLLTEGELVWEIVDAEGATDLTLRTTLVDYADGALSYRLDVPHHAFAVGLQPIDQTVPVAKGEATHRHLAIRVDGRLAAIKSPGSQEFDISAAKRAATHRLDLVVTAPVEDTDGDGMPDWWEDEQGLDKQSDDADGDLDGDGISNLHEFLGGSSASHDNRSPELLTSELFVYSGATSGVLLRTLDVDSTPDQVRYTLDAAPAAGTLLLRNAVEDPQEPDRALAAGDRFTQADVDRGRLVFRIDDEAADPPATVFTVSVRDEVPEHEADSGEVEVIVYLPSEGSLTEEITAAALEPAPLPGLSGTDELLLRNAALGRSHGFTIWDFSDGSANFAVAQPSSGLSDEDYQQSYLPKFGEAVSQVLVGGNQDDRLVGGMGPDLIVGARGDDLLRGGGAADRFVIREATDGNDTLEDFEVGPAGDSLDLSRVLSGPSEWLSDYLEFEAVAEGTRLGVDLDGDGSGFTDLAVTFSGLSLAATDLYQMLTDGNLLVGPLRLKPLVEVAAIAPVARENGPTPGAFEITRAGSILEAIEVQFQVTGSATNGSDYSFLSPRVTMEPGQSAVSVPVTPFSDTSFESAEVVEITLVEAAGYEVGPGRRAQVVIEDLRPEVSVEPLVARAQVGGGQSAMLLLSRSALLNRNVLVRLDFGGTATPGSDYRALSQFVELFAGESFRLLEVAPLGSAVLAGGAETVTVSIVDDPSYLVVTPRAGRVTIVQETIDLATWRDTHFPGNTDELGQFAAGDSGEFGIVHLLRYGFGLDAVNPFRVGPGETPSVSLVDGHLTLRYRENPAARDLSYRIELSPDLKSWREAEPSAIEEVTPLEAPAGVRVHRSTRPVVAAPFEFMRLRVIRQAP